MGRCASKANRCPLMKIAFVSTVQNYQWAGSEELWWQTAIKALEAGHEVACLVHAPMDQSDQIDDLTRRGGKVFVRQLRRHPRVTSTIEKLSSATKKLYRWKPGMVAISLGSPTDLCNWPSCLREVLGSGIPYQTVLQFNADSIHFAHEHRRQCRELFENASHCIFVSRQNQELLERQIAAELPKTSVLTNPIRMQLESPLSMPDGPLTIGCVARFETRWKSYDVLLHCLSQPCWRNREWLLNIYGGGPDQRYVEQLIRFYGLRERVRLKGYERDLKKIWGACHLKVLPSHGEGLPLAILEAMMCGRPVVATDVGGTREIVEEGRTGWIADAATPRVYGESLEAAWNSRERFEQMGVAAHQTAKGLAQSDPADSLLHRLTSE
ncbi:MAG: glycosyltransferase family 4 protein, partial [Planctomycetota bacterium]